MRYFIPHVAQMDLFLPSSFILLISLLSLPLSLSHTHSLSLFPSRVLNLLNKLVFLLGNSVFNSRCCLYREFETSGMLSSYKIRSDDVRSPVNRKWQGEERTLFSSTLADRSPRPSIVFQYSFSSPYHFSARNDLGTVYFGTRAARRKTNGR